jgi:hypothetical protein
MMVKSFLFFDIKISLESLVLLNSLSTYLIFKANNFPTPNEWVYLNLRKFNAPNLILNYTSNLTRTKTSIRYAKENERKRKKRDGERKVEGEI